MSPPIATATHRRATARRQAAARRRRSVLLVAGVAVVIIGIVTLMPMFRRAVNEFSLPLSYQDIIREQAAEKHLDPAFVAAVIYAETKFDPRPSTAGAEGLMQILPRTAEFLAHRSGATTFTSTDLSTPAVNIAYGSYYLRYLLDEYGNSEVLALAAYNGGETNVNRWIVQAHEAGHRFEVNDILFPETRAYVIKVLHAQRDYRTTYATQLGYR
ncbi:MAG: lytic transglycosylase domain-containing protein [Solirubrobacteraceae bacterium]